MENQIYNIEYIKAILTPVFESYDVKKAVVFGSYGKGSANIGSDIDIFVESNLKGLKFIGLLEDIRKTMKKDIDLFVRTHIEKDSLIDNEIKKNRSIDIWEMRL